MLDQKNHAVERDSRLQEGRTEVTSSMAARDYRMSGAIGCWGTLWSEERLVASLTETPRSGVRSGTERIPFFWTPSWPAHPFFTESRSTIGGRRGCNKFVPVLGGDDTRIAPTGDLFDQQSPREMSGVLGKLADHAGDHVVLSPKGVVLMTSSGTESSYPLPSQSLKHSEYSILC